MKLMFQKERKTRKMTGFENITTEVATDLIELVNQLRGLEKSAQVNYSVQNRKTGEWMRKAFDYVPLDNILNKIKENQNFALLQPIGVDENGINGVRCILVHKSGHVFETNTYPFAVKEGAKLQDEGAEITYRKRYSLGAFLGMATEEDTDGNDDEATNSTERKASPRQIVVLSKIYTGENLEKLLKMNNIEKLEDMPMSKASELISKNMKQRKAEKHD
nr:MAG TPA: ERF superfamily protein [Caudoviricetes sp.]